LQPIGIEQAADEFRSISHTGISTPFWREGSAPSRQDHMGRFFRTDMSAHLIAKARQVDACEERLPAAQQNGRDGDMHLVDKACGQELPDGGSAAADADIASLRCLLRAVERRLDTVRDE